MGVIKFLGHRLERWRRQNRKGRRPRVWYHPDYRIAVEGLGLETKRSDLCLWALVDFGVITPADVSRPYRIGYRALARVHDEHVLAALSSPEALAPVFGAQPSEIPIKSVARTIRFATGATLGAAREALATGVPQINLLGGFHHASPHRPGGFSLVNDIAVAIADLREEGLQGRVNVIDVDAHPPDGTADCVAMRPDELGDVWIGSLSGTDWGGMPGVDETNLMGADDSMYLETLSRLLQRMPSAVLTFVVAGGDVLTEDRFGGIAMTLKGARRRDEMIARALRDTPSVWLSGGGYSGDAWKVLFQTVVAAVEAPPVDIPEDYDPIRVRFSRVMAELAPPISSDIFSEVDLADAIGVRLPEGPRLLSTYTGEWLEHAFQRYGILEHIARLGYSRFRVEIDQALGDDRLRLWGHGRGEEHLLVETSLDRITEDGDSYLFVNWLTLRHPLAHFTDSRPQLPNQEVPGLGLAKEAGELLALMAERLNLVGVAIRPAAFHVAYTARYDFAFVDPDRQARFEALIRDLGSIPLGELTVAVDKNRVSYHGQPYRWEADLMAFRLDRKRGKPGTCTGSFALMDVADGETPEEPA